MSALVVDDRTWETWESERLKRAKVARARMEGPAPIVVFLCALGRWKPDAYRACPQPNSWLADCPACGLARAVAISESGDRGPVAIWCRTGCSKQAVIGALAAWQSAAERDDETDRTVDEVAHLELVIERLCEHIASEQPA